MFLTACLLYVFHGESSPQRGITISSARAATIGCARYFFSETCPEICFESEAALMMSSMMPSRAEPVFQALGAYSCCARSDFGPNENLSIFESATTSKSPANSCAGSIYNGCMNEAAFKKEAAKFFSMCTPSTTSAKAAQVILQHDQELLFLN